VLPLRDAAARWRVGLAWQTSRDDPVVANFVAFVKAAKKSLRAGATAAA
jgi:hypothetical protein